MILKRLMIVALFTITQVYAAVPPKHLSMDLFNALKYGTSLERLQRLVEQGADAKVVKTYDRDSANSALHYAIEGKCNSLFLLYLIEEGGISVNDRNNDHATPCHYAAKRDRGDLIKVLFSKGASVNCKDRLFGDTPLHVACSMGASNAVQALLDCGANLEEKNKGNFTPLDIARKRKHPEIVTLLENYENFLEIKEPVTD